MLALPTVVLAHETIGGSHLDWMLTPPPTSHHRAESEPGGLRLMTWRIDQPSWCWHQIGRFCLKRLPDHRRDYLTFEGRVSGNRGHVKRIDEGTAYPIVWSPNRAVLAMHTQHFDGHVTLERCAEDRWILAVRHR